MVDAGFATAVAFFVVFLAVVDWLFAIGDDWLG